MRRGWVRALVLLGWLVVVLVPSVYAVLYLVENAFEVPLSSGEFRFERPWAFLLAPAALLVLVARGFFDRARAPRLRVSRVYDMALAGEGWRVWARPVLVALRVVAVLLIALALMGPQSIHARDRAEVEGIDIVLTLDVSLSMNAEDIAPNRHDAMKRVVDEFVTRRPNDRIGAVIFGREAYTLLPLTTDHEALRTLISELQLGMIEGRGTAIGNAVGTALNRLRRSTAKSKVIILLTDGDSNSGNISPEQAADLASTMHVKLYTILMGSTSDASVQQGVDLFGRPVRDHGVFPINPELLQRMAQRTGGRSYRVGDVRALERSFHEILNQLERTEIEDAGRVFGELFPALVGPAFFLLMLELFLGTVVFRRWP